MGYIYLTIAIVSEVIATTALKASNGLTHLTYSLVVILGYGISFYYLSQVLKTLPVGMTYAIWSGLGIVLITLVSAFFFKQIPNMPTIIGMLFIIAGVLIINLFSTTINH